MNKNTLPYKVKYLLAFSICSVSIASCYSMMVYAAEQQTGTDQISCIASEESQSSDQTESQSESQDNETQTEEKIVIETSSEDEQTSEQIETACTEQTVIADEEETLIQEETEAAVSDDTEIVIDKDSESTLSSELSEQELNEEDNISDTQQITTVEADDGESTTEDLEISTDNEGDSSTETVLTNADTSAAADSEDTTEEVSNTSDEISDEGTDVITDTSDDLEQTGTSQDRDSDAEENHITDSSNAELDKTLDENTDTTAASDENIATETETGDENETNDIELTDTENVIDSEEAAQDVMEASDETDIDETEEDQNIDNADETAVDADTNTASLTDSDTAGMASETITEEESVESLAKAATLLTTDATLEDETLISTERTEDESEITEENSVTPQDFGAKGDNESDDTDAFNDAIDSLTETNNTLYVPAGSYRIDAVRSVSLKSNIRLVLDQDAKLVAIPNGEKSYNILVLRDISNVRISGGQLIGERYSHTGTEGEWGHGIGVYDSTNIVIKDVTIEDCWGDGIYLGSDHEEEDDAGCQDVTVQDCELSNNRRNDLSIVFADDVQIENCSFDSANGTDPQFGIDIETNNENNPNKHIVIENCTFDDNAKGSILISTTADDVQINNSTLNGTFINYSGTNVTLSGTTVNGDCDCRYGVILENDTVINGQNAEEDYVVVDYKPTKQITLNSWNTDSQNQINVSYADDTDSSSGKVIRITRANTGTHKAGIDISLSELTDGSLEKLVEGNKCRIEYQVKGKGTWEYASNQVGWYQIITQSDQFTTGMVCYTAGSCDDLHFQIYSTDFNEGNFLELAGFRILDMDYSDSDKNVSLEYRAHVQDVGTQDYVDEGETAGTTGQSLRMEALWIQLDNNSYTSGSIQYRAHVQDIGWMDWEDVNELAGTEGQSKRLEAIEIRLIGELAEKFDVYYCMHVQNFGWLDWAKNGEAAGSSGFSYRSEAIKVKLISKNGEAPEAIDINNDCKEYIVPKACDIVYKTHIQDYGNQQTVSNGEISGTTGQSKRLEGIWINLKNTIYSGNVKYKVHVQDRGWLDWRSNGTLAGTIGQSKRMEAIQITLTGELEKYCDIYYRVHVQDLGWMGWVKNGAMAGTTGCSRRMEAIQILILSKEQNLAETHRIPLFYNH